MNKTMSLPLGSAYLAGRRHSLIWVEEFYDSSKEHKFQTHHYLTCSIAHRSCHHPYVEWEDLDEGQEVGARIAE